MNRLLSLLLVPFLFVSCGKKESAGPEAQTLRLNIYTEPPTLDPDRATDSTSGLILDLLFEGLTRFDGDDQVVPGVAEKIEISPDGKTYTFTLRDSRWSNGTPVTAHDFEYGWKRALNPQFPGDYAYQMYVIKNGKQVKTGELPIDALGIRVKDDKTLVVELETPTPYFLQLLPLPPFFPIYQAIAQQDPNWAYEAGPHYVSNGPFQLENWKHHNEIVLVQNPHYWEAQSVKLKKILLTMVEDANTELSLFERGDIDWTGSPISIGIPTDAIAYLQKNGQLESTPQASLYFFIFNTSKWPYSNINLRKALAYAVDRGSIVENITQSGQLPATRLLPSLMGLKTESYFQDGNIKEAQRLFEKALAELHLTREQLPPLTLSYNTSEGHHKIAQAIQQQWKEALGVNVHLENAEWKVYLDNLQQKNFEVGRLGWIAPYKDPMAFLEIFESADNPMNRTGWSHPRYTALLQKARQTLDPDQRKEWLLEAEALLMNEMPFIPLYFHTANYMKNPKLKGVHVSPMSHIDFKHAYFE